MSQARSRLRKGRYVIADRQRLAALLQAAVDKGSGGSQRAAARAFERFGCTQRELNRLMRGKIGGITVRTATWITALVGPSEKRHVFETLVSPEARGRLVVYGRWTARTLASTPKTDHLEAALRRKNPDLFADFDRFLEKHGYVEVLRRSRVLLPRGRL